MKNKKTAILSLALCMTLLTTSAFAQSATVDSSNCDNAKALSIAETVNYSMALVGIMAGSMAAVMTVRVIDVFCCHGKPGL